MLTDPATCRKLNSELTNCPRTAAVLGEPAAQWQQMMGTLQRVEQEAVSHRAWPTPLRASEGHGPKRLQAVYDCWTENDSTQGAGQAAHQLEALHARSLRGWDFFDREAGKLMQRITKGTLRATDAWTDGRHAEDDKHVELDYELAVALANATEGAARATVLMITQTEPSYGFVAWQALVDNYAPKSSSDPATALPPILATPQRCKDAKELNERLTAWSLKVAEYEYQLKAIDETQKIFVVREMMPKDIKRESLTGPRKFDKIVEKLDIIVDEMMADDGPVPMDLGNVGTHDTKMTQNDSDTSNDMSYEDVCTIAWKGTGPARKQARRDRMDQEHGIVGKELMNGRAAREMIEARKEARRAPRAASPTGTVTRTKGAREKARARAKARVKRDTATTPESKDTSEWNVHTSGPTEKTRKMIKHHHGRVRLKERMLKNSRAWKRMTRKESGAGLRRAASHSATPCVVERRDESKEETDQAQMG